MNGVHDMGGMHGMGPIDPDPDEPQFHHEWERRVLAMTVAAGYLGRWNLDQSRHARERMPPAAYLGTSYYEHWLFGLILLLGEHGLLEPGELEQRIREPSASVQPVAGAAPLRATDVPATLQSRKGARVDAEVAPRFQVGDRVRARNINPVGHTRLVRYARGRQGMVDRDHGVWVFPDANAAGQGQSPQHVYSVRFAAAELWGAGAAARDSVYIDLWDDYLEPA